QRIGRSEKAAQSVRAKKERHTMSGFIKMLFTAFAQSITSFLYLLILLMVYAEIKKNARLEESW
ncbi:MAG TPA: hypothetical protein DDW86_07810, partial [Clostridiales bacterium]|nr:hypothetical protein [Clostridiales bacterium]